MGNKWCNPITESCIYNYYIPVTNCNCYRNWRSNPCAFVKGALKFTFFFFFFLCKPCFSNLGAGKERNISSLGRVGICALAPSTTVLENIRKKIVVPVFIFLRGWTKVIWLYVIYFGWISQNVTSRFLHSQYRLYWLHQIPCYQIVHVLEQVLSKDVHNYNKIDLLGNLMIHDLLPACKYIRLLQAASAWAVWGNEKNRKHLTLEQRFDLMKV